MEQRIKLLTDTYTTNPSEEMQCELNCLEVELDSIINQKTQFIIQQLKYKQYQYSNKMGKYLANQLKRKQEKVIILSIYNESDRITQNPQEINNSELSTKIYIHQITIQMKKK